MAYGYTPQGHMAFRMMCSNIPEVDVDFATYEWDKLHTTRAAIKRSILEHLDSLQTEKRLPTDGEDKGFDYAQELIRAIGDEMDARQSYGDKRPRRDKQGNGTEGWGSLAKLGGRPDSSDQWRNGEGRGEHRVHVLTREQRFADHIEHAEQSEVSFGGYVRAMILGARNEAERRALSEGSDSAGGFTVATQMSAQIIDAMRAQTTVIRAGAKTVPMITDKLSIARLDSDPTATWHAENAADFSDSSPTFSRVQLQARTLVALVKCSREVLEDSTNIESALRNAFAQAMALELDRVALLGTGAANEPRGVANFPNANQVSMGTNGAVVSGYDNLIDGLYELQLDNAGDPTAAIMHPRIFRDFAKLKDGQGLPMRRPEVVTNLPFLTTTQIPINDTHGTATTASRIFLGDYARLLIGIRTSLRIELLKERYAENFQYGMLAYLRADVAAERDQRFCVIKGVL